MEVRSKKDTSKVLVYGNADKKEIARWLKISYPLPDSSGTILFFTLSGKEEARLEIPNYQNRHRPKTRSAALDSDAKAKAAMTGETVSFRDKPPVVMYFFRSDPGASKRPGYRVPMFSLSALLGSSLYDWAFQYNPYFYTQGKFPSGNSIIALPATGTTYGRDPNFKKASK